MPPIHHKLADTLLSTCPPALVDLLLPWLPPHHEHCNDWYYQLKVFPALEEGGQDEQELVVALMLPHSLHLVRLFGTTATATAMPLANIERARLTDKPDKTTLDLIHGQGTSWLEADRQDSISSDLVAFGRKLLLRLGQ